MSHNTFTIVACSNVNTIHVGLVSSYTQWQSLTSSVESRWQTKGAV